MGHEKEQDEKEKDWASVLGLVPGGGCNNTEHYYYHCQFQSMEHIWRVHDHIDDIPAPEGRLIFTHVPHKAMKVILNHQTDDSQEKSTLGIKSADIYNGTITFEMKLSFEHQAVSSIFGRYIENQLEEQPSLAFEVMGGTNTPFVSDRLEKVSDYCWVGMNEDKATRVPRVVLEVGYSQPQTSLENDDASPWLTRFEQKVQTCLTINITQNDVSDRRKGRLEVKRWVRRRRPLTRRGMPYNGDEIECVQSVVLDPASANCQANIVGGPLVIPFAAFALREPHWPEHDIVLVDADLLHIGEKFWHLYLR